MQIRSDVPYVSDDELEAAASSLLDRYACAVQPVRSLPVPVDQIAEILLRLRFDWIDLPDDRDRPILAAIAPASRTIHFNERRKSFLTPTSAAASFPLPTSWATMNCISWRPKWNN